MHKCSPHIGYNMVLDTTIAVTSGTKRRIRKHGKFGEDDYDSIINRALDALERKTK